MNTTRLTILLVLALCFGLMCVNFWLHGHTDATEAMTTNSVIVTSESLSVETAVLPSARRNVATSRMDHADDRSSDEPRQRKSRRQQQHNTDSREDEDIESHRQPEKLTKHDVQQFLLRYFGLTKNDEDDQHLFHSNNNNTLFCESRRRLVWAELKRIASPALLRALKRQQRRHEAVAAGCPLEGQKYLVWSLSGGLGNRFQAVVSCLVASIVSGRVLLLKDWFTPLPNSRVKQQPVILPSPNTDQYFLEDLSKLLNIEKDRPLNSELLCPLFPMMSLREFIAMYPEEFSSSSGSSSRGHPQHVKIDISARHDRTLRRWNRFLCSNTSAASSSSSASSSASFAETFINSKSVMPRTSRWFFPERFVYIWTNQYFLPAFFANPFHAKEMREMFPDSNPYSILVRAIVAPALPVAQRVRDFFDKQQRVKPLDYVALQVRAFQDSAIVPLGLQFQQCFDQYLRDVALKSASSGDGRRNPGVAGFFLATLHEAVRQSFTKKYGTARVVTLAPAIGEQQTGKAHFDQEALTDMFLLALGKELFVSPGSTFGSFVVAYTQAPATVVMPDGKCKKKDNSAATSATTFEPCFAALHWYDKLLGRAEKLSCKLAEIPPAASGC